MSLGYTTKVANADCKVYVGNLGDNGDEKQLTKVFSKYGKLCSVWVAQRPSGFAFIEYEDNEDAEDAVRALDGREICGQRVRVEMRKKQRRIGNERTETDLRSRERNRNRSRSPVNNHHQHRPRDHESRDQQYYGGRENKNRDQYNNRNRDRYNNDYDNYNNDHDRDQYDNGRDNRYGGDYENSNGGGSGSNRSYGGYNDQNEYRDEQPGRQPRISIRRVHNSPPRLTREY